MLLDDEVIEFANREMSNVVISLDGRKCVNDKMRRTHRRPGHLRHDPACIQKTGRVQKPAGYYVRGTYTHYNTDFASDIIHMAESSDSKNFP